MSKDQTASMSFQELAKSWNTFKPAKPLQYEWIRVPVEREEEPDIVELTPGEVVAVGAALQNHISIKRVSTALEIDYNEAKSLLDRIHVKLMGEE